MELRLAPCCLALVAKPHFYFETSVTKPQLPVVLPAAGLLEGVAVQPKVDLWQAWLSTIATIVKQQGPGKQYFLLVFLFIDHQCTVLDADCRRPGDNRDGLAATGQQKRL